MECFVTMTPISVLSELLERVGTCHGGATIVSVEELHQWPNDAVKAMKKQKLIAKTHSAASVICPGCERNCMMQVHTLPTTTGKPSSFIVCDKRSDINRVSVSSERLVQWQCNAGLISQYISSSLGLRSPARRTDSEGRWEIGIVFGDKRSQMLCLETSGTVTLVAGNNKIPLAELIEFRDSVYVWIFRRIPPPKYDGTRHRNMIHSATRFRLIPPPEYDHSATPLRST